MIGKLFKDEELDAIFNENWHNKLNCAIELALGAEIYKNVPTEELINYMIDYNIQRTFQKQVYNKSVKRLPKKITWNKNTSLGEVFSDLQTILLTCSLCQPFEGYAVKLFGMTNRIKNHVLSWVNIANSNADYVTMIVEETRKGEIVLEVVPKD